MSRLITEVQTFIYQIILKIKDFEHIEKEAICHAKLIFG